MLASGGGGLGPICGQVCASECTSAQDCTERTSAMLGNWVAILGSRPVGQATPLMVAGFTKAGVLGDILKSRRSVWLGAPRSWMKMTFLALFCIVTGELVMSTAALSLLGRSSIAPLMPAPRSWKN